MIKRVHKSPVSVDSVRLALWIVLLWLIPTGTEAIEPNWPKPPYSVKQLRAWHKSLAPWPWLGQPEQKVNLRNERDYELLLAILGYARGGTFLLFAKHNGKWRQISDQIEQAHHPVRILEWGKDGWREFETFVPLWSGGHEEVLVSTYSWNGKQYVRKKSETGNWCDYEPFKANASQCSARPWSR